MCKRVFHFGRCIYRLIGQSARSRRNETGERFFKNVKITVEYSACPWRISVENMYRRKPNGSLNNDRCTLNESPCALAYVSPSDITTSMSEWCARVMRLRRLINRVGHPCAGDASDSVWRREGGRRRVASIIR